MDMRLSHDNTENQDCIETLFLGYEQSHLELKKVYFIWLVHGWQGGRDSQTNQTLDDLKDSYFTRYSLESGLVPCWSMCSAQWFLEGQLTFHFQ